VFVFGGLKMEFAELAKNLLLDRKCLNCGLMIFISRGVFLNNKDPHPFFKCLILEAKHFNPYIKIKPEIFGDSWLNLSSKKNELLPKEFTCEWWAEYVE